MVFINPHSVQQSEQVVLLTVSVTSRLSIAPLWISFMVMVIYFVLVAAGSCSGCSVCITLHDSHCASFDYRRQKKGVRGRSDDHALLKALQRFVGHPTESLYKSPNIMNGPKCDLNGLALIHLIAPHSV